MQTSGMKAKGRELELWIQTTNQFFNHVFFPAIEHDQLSVQKHEGRGSTLAKTQQGAR